MQTENEPDAGIVTKILLKPVRAEFQDASGPRALVWAPKLRPKGEKMRPDEKARLDLFIKGLAGISLAWIAVAQFANIATAFGTSVGVFAAYMAACSAVAVPLIVYGIRRILASHRAVVHDDRAVSPVVAVILMVAITVVLAAVTYAWVGGFAEQGNAPAGSLSLSTGPEGSGYVRDLIVVSASPSLTYGDLRFTLDGETYTLATTAAADGEWNALRGGTLLDGSASVKAGDKVRLDAAATTEGTTLRVAQASANTVLVQMRLN